MMGNTSFDGATVRSVDRLSYDLYVTLVSKGNPRVK